MSRVTIRRAGGDNRLVADLAADDTVTGGVGGWEQRARPRRTAMVAWTGTPPLVWQLPIILDGVDDDRSVERECRLLESWGRPGRGDEQPPTLVVNAPAGRAPDGAKWVLESIEWGEQTRKANHNRIQQEATLTLLEYIPGQVLKGPAAKSRDKRKKHKWVPISGKDRRCKTCKKPRADRWHTNRETE